MIDRKLKILIADDEEGLRLSMAGIMEFEGHDVVTANDGREAIEQVRKGSFDIAFLDIRMPGINGVDTFREVKKLSPETVVVMMTGYAVNELIREALQEGAYACVNKPFDMERIIDTIKEVSKKPFVMVIDDDSDLCSLLRDRFKDNGFNVVTRASGEEGIETALRRVPDVIFLDVVMDGMDGIATLKKLKEQFGDRCPKVVIMSSYNDPKKFEEARSLGAAACMQKPLDMKRLPDTVRELLTVKQQSRICIIGNDQSGSGSIRQILSDKGYEVEVAANGSEAIESIRREACKCVIVDMKNNNVDGLQMYEKLKQADSDAGVIFISSHESDDAVADAIRSNTYIYLHKPFDPEQLLRMIDNIKECKCQKES